MVTHLVRDDIRACKIAGGMKAGFHLVEKTQIEIDPLIAGTIERSHGVGRRPAGSGHSAVEQVELGLNVSSIVGLEVLTPDILRAAQDRSHEAMRFVSFRGRFLSAFY